MIFGALYALQRPWREYPGVEYENFPIPPDYQEKTEWVFARLMYPAIPGSWGFRGNPDWQHGRTNWTIDYPRSDRHIWRCRCAGSRASTRARSSSPSISTTATTSINYPWLYGVEVGHWELTDAQAAKLRDYPAARRLLHVRRFPRHRTSGRSSSPA